MRDRSDRRRGAQRDRRGRRLEPDITAADHRQPLAGADCRLERFGIVEMAQFEHAGEIAARDAQPTRGRTGRQHQLVIGLLAAVVQQDAAVLPVDPGDGLAEPERDVLLGIKGIGAQLERLLGRLALEKGFGQGRAVIRRHGFGADQDRRKVLVSDVHLERGRRVEDRARRSAAGDRDDERCDRDRHPLGCARIDRRHVRAVVGDPERCGRPRGQPPRVHEVRVGDHRQARLVRHQVHLAEPCGLGGGRRCQRRRRENRPYDSRQAQPSRGCASVHVAPSRLAHPVRVRGGLAGGTGVGPDRFVRHLTLQGFCFTSAMLASDASAGRRTPSIGAGRPWSRWPPSPGRLPVSSSAS